MTVLAGASPQPVGRPDAGFAIRDVRAVLPDRVVDDAVVVCADGLIESVSAGGHAPPGALDGRGALLLPGIVDVHSDALEREVNPRPGTEFPLDFALLAFESRARAAGVTTVFHGVGFQSNPGTGRSLELARATCAVLRDRAERTVAAVDHRILYRMDARSPDALDVLLDCLPDEAAEHPPLVSLEDHTPGQGQFRNLDAFVAARMREQPGRTRAEAMELVAARIAERDELASNVERNRDRLGALACGGRIRLLAHDVASTEELARVRGYGARVAEFPVSMEAARAARAAGMPVVMGAPNVIRGGSHSGNVGAREAVAAGVVDALASDYAPPTLLAAAFGLAAERVLGLPAAVRLVTSGPARTAGLADRGALAPGGRGDLVLVGDAGRWPQVRLVLPMP